MNCPSDSDTVLGIVVLLVGGSILLGFALAALIVLLRGR